MPTDDRGDTIHRKEYSDQRTELIERIAKLEGSLNAERESRIGLQRTMEAMFRSEEAARSKTEVLITEKFEQQNQWQRRFDSQSSRMVTDTMMEDKLSCQGRTTDRSRKDEELRQGLRYREGSDHRGDHLPDPIDPYPNHPHPVQVSERASE